MGKADGMFTYNDVVTVRENAPTGLRPDRTAWVIGITRQLDRIGVHFDEFPPGTIYLVEFEDGEALDIHESMLTAFDG